MLVEGLCYPESASKIGAGAPVICLHLVVTGVTVIFLHFGPRIFLLVYIPYFSGALDSSLVVDRCILPDIVGLLANHAVASG